MNTRSKAILGLILVGMFLLVSAVLAQTSTSGANIDKLYGSWNVEVMTVNQPGADGSHRFPALLTFGDEGSVITDEPPSLGETSGHGNWISNEDGSISYTFVGMFSDGQGAYTGKLKVVGTLQYDSAADTWKGPFKIDAFDADGKVVGSDTGTFDMARITVEMLE